MCCGVGLGFVHHIHVALCESGVQQRGMHRYLQRTTAPAGREKRVLLQSNVCTILRRI